MTRNSVLPSDFLKKRLAPFLLNNRAKRVRKNKALSTSRRPLKVQHFIPAVPTTQSSEMDCNAWTLQDAAEDFGALNENCNCNATVTLRSSSVEEDKEYFTLDISSWDDSQKQEPSLPDNSCSSSSFGYVHEIDLYLAESECSSCETECNEGLFASFDEAAPDDLACVEDSMCFTV